MTSYMTSRHRGYGPRDTTEGNARQRGSFNATDEGPVAQYDGLEFSVIQLEAVVGSV